jgi:hypothetical protein
MDGIGLFLIGDAGVIVATLYDSFAKKGKEIADRFANLAIEMLQNRKEGKEFMGEPLKKDAEPEPETETHEEPKKGFDDDEQPPRFTPQEVRVILDAMFKEEDK